LLRITQVAKLQTGTLESRSKAVQVATCIVLQLRLNASVISLHLIVYRRVQQTAAVELHTDIKQELEEGRGEQVYGQLSG
jgi:hypothetical protein